MKSALADLYAYTIKFFIRAIEWFRENPFQHILHSITRPPELRYKDLLEDIESQSRRLDQLAASGSQAEVRAIHLELSDTRTAVMDMRKMMAEFQAINSSAAIDTNQRVTDIQFSNIISSVSLSALGDHVQAYQNLARLAKSGKRAEKQSMGSLCSSRILMAWSNSDTSEAAAIKGSFRTRLAVRYFCVAVVEQLQQSGVTVLWAFNNVANDSEGSNKRQISSVDILKHLTLQALKAGRPQAFVHEKSLAVTCSQFHTAITAEEWFRIFKCVLVQLSGPVFIIIDLQVLHTASLEVEGFNWATALLSFFDSLSQCGTQRIFKILLVGYGPVMSGQVGALHSANRVVTVKPPRGVKHQRAVSIRGGPVKLKQSWVKKR